LPAAIAWRAKQVLVTESVFQIIVYIQRSTGEEEKGEDHQEKTKEVNIIRRRRKR
jgi:hypothetical protein